MPSIRKNRPYHFYGPDRRNFNSLKPEYALDRAEQLISVGQELTATMALYNIITDNQNQRKRQWNAKYEGIMMKLMELCVKLRKPNLIKEALHKYRALCSHQNVASLEKVTRYLVKEAEEKTEAARLSVKGDNVDMTGTDDLEEIGMETAETLLLEAAGAEQSKERTDRQVVIPWMKFLWEVFRVVLDIVKSHSKLEQCYHDMAKHAFRFCQRYNRFSEFRRLCDILRQHLNHLIKYPRPNANDVQISNPETTQHFLETRFLQLQTSVELRNWQEAYRTIEDIHMLISLSKKMPRAQTMGIYYERLTQVFWMSKNYLYHAHALHKLYSLSIKQNKNLSADEAKMMATKLLIAALCVPPFDLHSATLADSYGLSDIGGAAGENAARHARMAAILGYSSPAQRLTLIEDILQKGINQACHDEVKDLFPTLEQDMEPLKLSDRMKPALEFIENTPELADYAEPLKRVAVYRLLEQLGKVYSLMKLPEVGKLASFTTLAEVETTALEALKTRSLSIRFDHQNNCILFESSLFSTVAMKEQLTKLGQSLEAATRMWNLDYARQIERKLQTRKEATVRVAKVYAEDEWRENVGRKLVIEQRKEEQERRTMAAAMEMKRKVAAAKKKRDEDERSRRKEEQEQRDRDKQKREEQQQRQQREDVDPTAVDTTAADDDETSALAHAEVLIAREKEKKEAEKKVALLAKRMDYLERALREENRPLVTAWWEKHCEEMDREAEEAHKKAIESARLKHEVDLKRREKLAAITDALGALNVEIDDFVEESVQAWIAEEEENERRQAEEEERRREEEQQRMEEEAARKEELRKEEEERRQREAEEEAARKEKIEQIRRERDREIQEEKEREEHAREKREAEMRERERELEIQREKESMRTTSFDRGGLAPREPAAPARPGFGSGFRTEAPAAEPPTRTEPAPPTAPGGTVVAPQKFGKSSGGWRERLAKKKEEEERAKAAGGAPPAATNNVPEERPRLNLQSSRNRQ